LRPLAAGSNALSAFAKRSCAFRVAAAGDQLPVKLKPTRGKVKHRGGIHAGQKAASRRRNEYRKMGAEAPPEIDWAALHHPTSEKQPERANQPVEGDRALILRSGREAVQPGGIVDQYLAAQFV
jgi:hypothetical protein